MYTVADKACIDFCLWRKESHVSVLLISRKRVVVVAKCAITLAL
jgi:hypothetical protein